MPSLYWIYLFALRIAVSYSRLYSVREIWFVSTCYSRQGNSCVRAPLHSRSNLDTHCIRSFVHRRGHITFSESSSESLALGPRWLFLLSRHRKAISAAANQKPFCKLRLCTRKYVKRTIKEVKTQHLASAWQLKMSGNFSRELEQYSYND